MTTADRLATPRLTAAETRRAAKLAKIVRGIPASGAVLIVHSRSVVPATRRLVEHLRGPVVAGAVRVLVAAAEADEAPLRSGATPVFRDPFVLEQREHARALAGAWRH